MCDVLYELSTLRLALQSEYTTLINANSKLQKSIRIKGSFKYKDGGHMEEFNKKYSKIY